MTKTETKKRTAKNTKSSIVKRLLERKDGATVEAMCEATGWQSHSCRAFLTGLRKKGREVVRYRNDKGESTYKMTPLEAAKAKA
ncbi:DUF3489 domain-containing protein [Altererythrobacter xiamenensis]|uniref:DUF3489 domain-containing protein n=1 Tax=Altererythrobacter xiamenensis TaxID=1316679 RepID=UPI000A3A9651|nr:DUF3489 domain-containing protein [Altererythrobacter xiamenensis]